MAPSYKLRVLGAPMLFGTNGPEGGVAARAQSMVMLARLAMDGAAGTPRGALTSLLWPNSPEDSGRHALSNLVYQVRRSVGKDALSSQGDVLRLPAERWEVDCWAFRQAVAEGDNGRAVATYQAPFLDGIRAGNAQVEHWIARTNQSLEDAYLRALEALARRVAHEGDATEAVRWWQMAVCADPLHSSRTSELMVWLARSGNAAEAIRVSQRHAELRRSELGLDPEPSVLTLADRIRSGGDPTLTFAVPGPRGVGAPWVAGTPGEPVHDIYEEYLTALFLAGQLRPEATEQAALRLEWITRESPDFAAAHATLGRVLIVLLLSGSGRPRQHTLEQAMASAARGVELAPNSGDAHATSAWVTVFHRWDLDLARAMVEHARSLGIHDPHTMSLAAVTLSICGDGEGAASLASEAVARDPFQYIAEFWSVWITRQFRGDAAPYLKALCERRPDSVWGLLLWALSIPDDIDKVSTLTQVVLDLPRPNVLAFSIASAARAQAGDMEHVDQALAVASDPANESSHHFEQALVLSAANRMNDAADAYVRAVVAREPNALGWWRDPLIRPLLAVPRVWEAAVAAGLGLELTPRQR